MPRLLSALQRLSPLVSIATASTAPARPWREWSHSLRSDVADTRGQGVTLLTSHEEQELARLAPAGDVQALDHLILANLRLVVLVVYVAEKCILGVGKGVPIAELISEGNPGLIGTHCRRPAVRSGERSTFFHACQPMDNPMLRAVATGAIGTNAAGMAYTAGAASHSRLGVPNAAVRVPQEAWKIHLMSCESSLPPVGTVESLERAERTHYTQATCSGSPYLSR